MNLSKKIAKDNLMLIEKIKHKKTWIGTMNIMKKQIKSPSSNCYLKQVYTRINCLYV